MTLGTMATACGSYEECRDSLQSVPAVARWHDGSPVGPQPLTMRGKSDLYNAFALSSLVSIFWDPLYNTTWIWPPANCKLTDAWVYLALKLMPPAWRGADYPADFTRNGHLKSACLPILPPSNVKLSDAWVYMVLHCVPPQIRGQRWPFDFVSNI